MLLTWVAGEAASVVDRLSDGEILGNLTSLIRYLTIHTKKSLNLLKHDKKSTEKGC